jgi:hypothetical protein
MAHGHFMLRVWSEIKKLATIDNRANLLRGFCAV